MMRSTRMLELFSIFSTLRFVPCARMAFPLPSMTPRPRIFVFWIWNSCSLRQPAGEGPQLVVEHRGDGVDPGISEGAEQRRGLVVGDVHGARVILVQADAKGCVEPRSGIALEHAVGDDRVADQVHVELLRCAEEVFQ